MYRGKYTRRAARTAAPTEKKRPRVGSVVFYSIYGFFIIAFLAALLFGLNMLQDWLVRYEASQPEHKAEQTFQQLFSNPDWAALYDLSGIEDTAYEGRDAYASYMTHKAGNTALTYEETSAGLSGDRKYIVSLAGEKIATFTLTGGSDTQTEIATWELGAVKLFFQRSESILVEKLPEHTVYINGVPLDSSHTVRTVSTAAEDFLPEGIHGYRMEQQYLDNLLVKPQVTVKDADGNPVTMVADPETGILSPVLPEAAPMTEAEKEIAFAAAKAYSEFSIQKITKAQLAQYFDKNSAIYEDIVKTDLFVQSIERYEFLTDDNSFQDFYRYSDNLFSIRVVMTMRIHRLGWQKKDFNMNTTYFFTKNEDGNYLVTNMSNIPMQDPVQQVRLTFRYSDSIISSQMVDSSATTLTLPEITAPEGQVLKGWAVQEDNGDGKITMTIVFTPGQNGTVQLDPQKPLEPMTLYPVFEKEPS